MDERDIKKSILSTSADEKRIYKTRITKFKKSHFLYVVLLICLAILQFISIAFFTRGFLLSRQVLTNISNHTLDTNSLTPKFNKTIVLIVDALRFDFAIPVDRDHPKFNAFYHNNMPVFYNNHIDDASSSSSSSLLLKFMADPPTTTLQRLKGLTTGSLPTFIDAGSNFAGEVIEEDNLIKQFHLNDKDVWFVGDDTWDALFHPFLSPHSVPYESLNVWDLHTVDNGVISFFNDNLNKSDEWDVLIGHMLGVDHVGHKYGPNHHTMKDKQQQVNTFIEDIIATLDEDTLLVVMGDHGMDHTGNHGGDSIDELESTIFFHSKRPNLFHNLIDSQYNTSDLGKSYRSINQIDLVSTLSLLLGLPVPFNNLGWPIKEFFTDEKESQIVTKIMIDQLLNYKETIGLEFNDNGKKSMINNLLNEISSQNNDFTLGHQYEMEFLELCKDLWARFDYYSIATGLIFMTISLILLVTITKLIPSIVMSQMVNEFAPWIALMSLMSNICFFSIYYVFRTLPIIDNALWCFLFATAVGIVIGCCGPIFDRYNFAWILSKSWEDLFSDYWSCIGWIIIILHACLFASNSFTIWEDKIVTFLLISLGMLTLFEFVFLPRRQEPNALLTAKISENEGTTSGVSASTANSNNLPLSRFARLLGGYHSLVLIICTRIASMITICREEQGEFCTPTFTTVSNNSMWCLALCFLAIFIIPSCIKGYYNLTSSYQAAAPIWIDIFLKGTLFINFIYWSLTSIENSHTGYFDQFDFDFDFDLNIIRYTIARIIAGFSLIASNFGWAMGPLCIKLNVHNTDVNSRYATILGYMNIYGSEYFLLVINMLMAILLFNKPLAQLSICLMCNQMLSILEITDLLKLKENMIGPIALGLLSYQQFFSTGHQATIPSVQWDVAFILTDKINFPLSHIALVLNTFGPHILVALSVALVTLWKQQPDVLKPQTLLGRIVSNCGMLLTYNTVLCLSSFIWVTVFRRHLMVWKIFCPRFMFACFCLIITQVVIIFGTVAFATSRLIQHINDIFWK